MKIPIWEYSNQFYLKINAVKVKEAKVENGFQENHPYIMDLSSSKCDFQKERRANYRLFNF